MTWFVVSLGGAAGAADQPFSPPAPLRIGIGGDYPDGLDGVLMEHGLPHERIFPWELADPAVLKRFDVLLLSCPVSTRGALDPVLREWVMAGGRVYIEVWAGMQGASPFPDLVIAANNTPPQADTVLSTSDHPILRGLDPKLPIDTFHLQGTFLRPRQPEAKVLAQFAPDGGGTPYPYGIAALEQPLGKGEIVYTGSPLSFCCFHRGPTTEPLLMKMVDFLAGGRAVPRLTTGASEPEDGPTGAAAGGGMPATADEAGAKAPAGYELLEESVDAPYNVSAQVAPPALAKGDDAVVLLDAHLGADGKLKRPALWLVLGASVVSLRAGASLKSPVIASAKWQPPTEARALLLKRRAGSLAVVLGDQELLSAKTTVPASGAVACASGRVALTQRHVQPVEPPDFSDDFMRDPGDPSPWTPVSGQWRVVGIGNEQQSVNGFYYQSYGTDLGLTATGETWWEDYCASMAVRPDGGATVGLAALRQENGDYVAFVAESAENPAALMKLVQKRGAKETILAQKAGGLAPGQWWRLTIRAHEGKLEGLLDGAPVVEAPLAAGRGGGMGLLAQGSARFDDVMVQSAALPLASPRHEGTPAADLPASLGPQDTLTWANLAADWAASPTRPSLLWHTGHFGADVTASLRLDAVAEPARRRLVLAPAADSPDTQWCTLTASLTPNAKQATLAFQAPGKPAVEKRVDLGEPGRMVLVRQGSSLVARWNQTPLWKLDAAPALTRVGLEVMGPAVAVEAVRVRGPQVRDYVFGVAPVEWHVASGTWEVASRWACDNRWSWFAGWGEGDFSVWNKHRVEGDVVVDTCIGIKMQAPGGPETQRCRDTNVTLCGDGTNPRSGYSFVMGGDGGAKTQLLRNGAVVAEAPDLRVPGGYGIHHEWFHLRVARVGKRIEMDFEGRPVFRYEDPEPLAGGFVGVWSHDSGILVPRVTIYQ